MQKVLSDIRWRPIGLWLVLFLVGQGCGWRGPHVISDETFTSLYPSGVSEVQVAVDNVDEARELKRAAENAQRGGELLAKALVHRFEELETALDRAEAFGVVALHERWGGESIDAAAACGELRGGLAYIHSVAADVGKYLVRYRKALRKEADALLELRLREFHASKIDPFFAQVPAGPEFNPTDLHTSWQAEIDLAKKAKDAAADSRKQAADVMNVALAEYESYRSALPQDTTCPIFLRHDPLLQPLTVDGATRDWIDRLIR